MKEIKAEEFTLELLHDRCVEIRKMNLLPTIGDSLLDVIIPIVSYTFHERKDYTFFDMVFKDWHEKFRYIQDGGEKDQPFQIFRIGIEFTVGYDSVGLYLESMSQEKLFIDFTEYGGVMFDMFGYEQAVAEAFLAMRDAPDKSTMEHNGVDYIQG